MRLLALATVLSCAPVAFAGPHHLRLLVLENNAAGSKLWLLTDANDDGVISEGAPDGDEVALFFDSSNASGVPLSSNPNGLHARRNGEIAVGDFTNRNILILQDLNGNGDAQDVVAGVPEARVFAHGSVWSNFNSPFGLLFDQCNDLLVSNSGNTTTPDGVFLLQDLNADGDADDGLGGPTPELSSFCTASPIGPGNTSSVPSEMVRVGNAIYIRDSAAVNAGNAGITGVNRLVDLAPQNRNANDPGELTSFVTFGNASGVSLGAGFSIDVDPVHAGALYFNQTVSVPASSTDQIIRAQDLNFDNDAMDPGEAVIAYSNTEGSAFNIADFMALPDGSLLVADSASKKIFRLADSNSDGTFASDNSERTVVFNNSLSRIASIRRIARLPDFCQADLDNDGDATVAIPDNAVDINDLLFFLIAFESGSLDADVDNGSGQGVADCAVDINDLLFFLVHFENGC